MKTISYARHRFPPVIIQPDVASKFFDLKDASNEQTVQASDSKLNFPDDSQRMPFGNHWHVNSNQHQSISIRRLMKRLRPAYNGLDKFCLESGLPN